MRLSVKGFAFRMEEVLKANDDKGGWENEDNDSLLEALRTEVGQLRFHQSEMNKKLFLKTLIDVANYSMMLWDNNNN